MSPREKKLIQSAAESMRRDHPILFGVLSATLRARNLSEACRACNYPSPEDFASDYHQAIEYLFKQLRDLGYVPPSKTDSFEERIGQISPSSHFKLPSREIINRFYKGHILHEACALVAKQNHLGLSKLWAHFPSRRHEIEIAIALTSVQPSQSQSIRLPYAPIQRTQQRFLPALAGAFALGIVLLLALSPPPEGRAFKAIVTNFEEMLVSAQGIFDMSKDTQEEASITKPDPEPRVQATPEPAPRPKIALPDKPRLALASLPDIPRQLDRPSLSGLITPPRVSTPDLDRGPNPSTFFGSRPEVHVARATMSMPAHAPTTLPSTDARAGEDQPEQQAESTDLKGYRPAGRIGFSNFHTSAGLSAELVRLTRIQRTLSQLKTPQNRIYENAQLTLAPDKARIQFADGVAFILTFRLGRLDGIQIFARSGIDKALHIETEARRGIHFLNRALSNS
ncbi:MAG: hypothetical protein OXG87_17905 [Gemmatimonadetes bacterium]|nr:hypothetical protein [Gemmatimonadota bacterium]